MAKRKLNRKREFIQVPITPEDKAAFDAWCAENQVTMAEIVRRSIAPYVLKGQEILERAVSWTKSPRTGKRDRSYTINAVMLKIQPAAQNNLDRNRTPKAPTPNTSHVT